LSTLKLFVYICQVLTIKHLVMTEIILEMEQELRDEMQEMIDAFGPSDPGTVYAATKWAVMADLLTRLKLEPND
jgi:hypothetical protein